jgi:hypothetical protein
MKFPAAVYNKMLDTIKAVQRQKTIGAGQDAGVSGGADIVLVRNDSGADQQRFAVMGIDGIVISPTDNANEFYNHPILSCAGVNPELHAGKWVVIQEPLKNGSIGRAVISGVTITQIYLANVDHKHADLNNGYSYLYSAFSGAGQILWFQYPGQVGYGWAVIRIAHPMQSEPMDTTGLEANMVQMLRSYGGVLKPTWDHMTIYEQE